MADKEAGVGGGGEVFAEAGLEAGPNVLAGVEVGRVGREEQSLTTRGGDQRGGGRRLMKPRVVQHDDAARRQHGQQPLFKIDTRLRIRWLTW